LVVQGGYGELKNSYQPGMEYRGGERGGTAKLEGHPGVVKPSPRLVLLWGKTSASKNPLGGAGLSGGKGNEVRTKANPGGLRY